MATEITNQLYPSAHALHHAPTPAVELAKPPAPAPAEDVQKPHHEAPRPEIHKIVEDVNNVTKMMNTRLRFYVDHETNDVIVKLIDTNTEKVIKELPPAELQKLHKSLKEALGVLINELI